MSQYQGYPPPPPGDPYYGGPPPDPYAPPPDPWYGQPPASDPYGQGYYYPPPPPPPPPPRPPRRRSGRGGSGAAIVGLLLVLVGVWILFGDRIDLDLDWGELWPYAVVIIGALMVVASVIPGRTDEG